jgi:hypothetical protein
MAERIRNPKLSTRLREAFALSFGGSSSGVNASVNTGSVEKSGSVHQSDVDVEKLKGENQVVFGGVWFTLSPSTILYTILYFIILTHYCIVFYNNTLVYCILS